MMKISADFLRLYLIVVGVDARFINDYQLGEQAKKGDITYYNILTRLSTILLSDDEILDNIFRKGDAPNGDYEKQKLVEAIKSKGELPDESKMVATALNELLDKILERNFPEDRTTKLLNSIQTILISVMNFEFKTNLPDYDNKYKFTRMRTVFWVILNALVKMQIHEINNFAYKIKRKNMISLSIIDELIEEKLGPDVQKPRLSDLGDPEQMVHTPDGKQVSLAKSVGNHGKIPVESLVISWFEVNFKIRKRNP